MALFPANFSRTPIFSSQSSTRRSTFQKLQEGISDFWVNTSYNLTQLNLWTLCSRLMELKETLGCILGHRSAPIFHCRGTVKIASCSRCLPSQCVSRSCWQKCQAALKKRNVPKSISKGAGSESILPHGKPGEGALLFSLRASLSQLMQLSNFVLEICSCRLKRCSQHKLLQVSQDMRSLLPQSGEKYSQCKRGEWLGS